MVVILTVLKYVC